ncbi:MAG TPA: CoA transferase [Dehalococcoidia bacterium]|nr:CoA transferase [Dehalococcoidia bacterium]
MRRPLAGIRVLDLSIWQQGTYATALLADLGADVIKVEEPVSGDPGRYFDVVRGLGLSAYFEAHNRGKRSLAVDLKDQRGRDVLLAVAKHADVFLTNFRAGAVARMGLTYEALSAANPGIVYVQASGHGNYGDEADLGSFDILAQARGGLMSMTGEPDDPPLPAGIPIADQVGALHATIAVLAGLAGRNADGRGVRIDTSLLGSQLSLQAFNITKHLFSGELASRRPRGGTTPFWRVYRAGDSRWFVIGMLLDRAWPQVAHAIGRPDLAADERFATYRKRTVEHGAELIAELDAVFATAPAAEWIARLNEAGMFAAPVQDYADVASDPQVIANGYIQDVPHPGGAPVRLVGSGLALDGEPLRIERLAPQHGEHTEAVLLEAGFTWDEIVRLREDGVVGPRRAGE